MFSRLKIFHKALILVLVPLVVECAFIMVLFKLLDDAELEIRQEQQAREVVTHLNNIMRLMFKGAARLPVEGFTEIDPKKRLEYKQRDEFRKLKLLVANDSRMLAKVKHIEQLFNRGQKHYREAEDYARAQDAIGIYRQNIERVRFLYRDVCFQLEEAIKEAEAIEARIPSKQKELRQKAKELLIYGLIANILIAYFLVRFFNRSTARRLYILMDNTRRISAGEELHPPVGGVDEISELDAFLAEMAGALSQAAEKEREALERVKQSETRVRKMVETLPAGVIVADADSVIEYVNPPMAKMFNYPQLKFDQRHISDFLDLPKNQDFDRREFVQYLARMSDGKAQDVAAMIEAEARRPDGSDFPVEVSCRELSWSDDKRYLIALTDISERQRLEELKQEFIGMVTHDVRSPLNSLQAFLDLLDEDFYGSLTEQGHKKIAAAEQNISMVVRLISDLLDLDKIEAGLLELELGDVNLNEAAVRSMDSVRNLADRRKIQLVDRVPETEMRLDEDRLVQVLVNLLSNAIKFSPKQGTVTLMAARNGSSMLFEVIDEGPGIPEEERDKVFDRFSQIKGRGRGGSGLGLAICKALVTKHGGKIGVKDNPDGGSCFWFTLPTES